MHEQMHLHVILYDSFVFDVIRFDLVGLRRHTIVPAGSGAAGVRVDVAGEERAKGALAALVASHGWVPVDRGGLGALPALEPGRRA